MPEVIVIVVAFVGLAVVARLAVVRAASEKKSVESHKRTLEVISKVSEHGERPAGHVKISGNPVRLDLSRLGDLTDPDMIRIQGDESPRQEELAAKPPIGNPSVEEVPLAPASSRPPLEFGEFDSVAEEQLVGATEVLPSIGHTESQQNHRIYSVRSRKAGQLPLLVAGTGAAAVVLGGVFFLLSGSKTATPQTPSAPVRTRQAAKKKSAKQPSASVRPVSLSPQSTTANGATYMVPGGVNSVVMKTSAPCWMEDSAAPGSTILWDSTLPAGGSYTLNGNGSSLWLRTGNSGVLSLTVNGLPVVFHAPPGPYDFYFESAPATSAT